MQEYGHSEELCGLVAVIIVSRYLNSLGNHNEGRRSRREQQEQMEAAGGKSSKSNWFKMDGATNVL